MVSALTTTRLISAQLALQMLQTDVPSSQSSDSSSLLGDLSSLPSQSQASLTNLLNGLSSSQTTDTADSSSADSSDDPAMNSSDFMALLKSNLQVAVQNGDGGQAQAMLDAMTGGTLTVSDPTAGTSVQAWDPDDPDEKDTTTKDTTAIGTEDWNDFLKTHLQRGSDGSFVRNSDGSFIDKTTGDEAYFGQVGNRFYYITWPAASGTAASGASADSQSEDASATDSANTGA